MNADGSGQTRLTNNPAIDCQADLVARRQAIAFTSPTATATTRSTS